MPTYERTSPSSVTPATVNTTPEKPRTFSENRKSSKPIMEKRRRARINESLAQLKTLILNALKKDSSRHSKLEKADILEMTVKHLRNLQRVQMTAAVNSDPSILGKYRAGFSECVEEVTRFLSTCEGVNTDVRTRLLGHLAACVSQINAVNFTAHRQVPLYTPHPGARGFGQTGAQIPGASPQMNGAACKSVSAVHIPPDAVKLYSGFQVVPTPDGQFTILIPSATLAPLSAQNSHPALAVAMSPVLPPAATSDSVWRPW
ncbi:transcription factor HES-1-B-like [Polymixia lowei]